MNDNKYGVITEQGYAAGSFGFQTVTEEEQKKIKESVEFKPADDNDKP